MEELKRKELIKQAKEEAKKMTGRSDRLREALLDLARSFTILANTKHLETSLLCKTYFKKEDPEFAQELSGKLSRPIAFGLPETLSEDKLLILVAQTAMDCLEELELSRQACTLINPSQIAYSSEFVAKAPELFEISTMRSTNDD
jgi:hypothetical protein